MFILLFLLVPMSTIPLVFLKDRNKNRKITLNTLLIINTVYFFAPILMAILLNPAGGNIFNENTGGGAALWLYILVLPSSAIIQLVLMILKIVNASKE